MNVEGGMSSGHYKSDPFSFLYWKKHLEEKSDVWKKCTHVSVFFFASVLLLNQNFAS